VKAIPGNECDLVIRGGTVVTAGSSGECDVGVQDGKVAQLGGSVRGRTEIDASGALVLPGGVDMHVHLSLSSAPVPGAPAWIDDFASGSRAGIAGGVTTVGNMTFPWAGQTLSDAISRDLGAAAGTAAVDYVLHPVLVSPTPEALAELPGLAADGHTSLKLFMMMPEFEARIDDAIAAIRLAGRSGMLTMLHCEDGALVRFAGSELIAQGGGGLADWGVSRPDSAERAAVERAVAICAATGSPIYIVHLSSAAALESAMRGQARGLPVYVETRPLYLHLTGEVLDGPDAGKYIGCPPLRDPADLQAMWTALGAGSIHTLGSDHAPWSLADKTDSALTVLTARAGVADLETMLPMLFSEGVRTGRISLCQFVSLTSTSPARLFGLFPRKGTIAIGSDADLIVLDPQRRRVIDGATMESRAGYSPYDGWEVVGWPRFTVSRGEVVLEDGEVIAEPGRGRWLHRSGGPQTTLRFSPSELNCSTGR
jgi:dihydropyrimidinase